MNTTLRVPPIATASILARCLRGLFLRLRCHYLVIAIGCLTCGPLAAQGIALAYVGPLSGPAAPDAQALHAGMQAHFDEINKAGGVGGRKLSLIALDDKYDGDEFERQFEAVMEKKPVALLAPLGLASMRKLLGAGLLNKHDIVVVNAIPGATPFRVPGHPRLFHVRAGDREQIDKAFRHAVTMGISSLHVVVQDIRAGGADIDSALKSLPADTKLRVQIKEVPNRPGALAEAMPEIARSSAQAFLVIGSPPYMAEAVAELRKAGISKIIFAMSYLPPGLVLKLAGAEAARGVSIMQTFPNPMGQTLPLHRQFQGAMKASQPDINVFNTFHLEGYLSARVLTEAMKRTAGAISPAALAVSLRRMGPVDLGGFRVDFSDGNTGSRFVDIAVITPAGRLMY